MNELERYKAWLAQRTAHRPSWYPPQKPGYIAPPAILIAVPNSRSGAGNGMSNYWSLQTELQQYMQAWVADFNGFTDEQIHELLWWRAADAAAWLGPFDSDSAPWTKIDPDNPEPSAPESVKTLVNQVYQPIYKLATTPA